MCDRYGAYKKVFTDRQILRRLYTYTEAKQINKQTVCLTSNKDNYYFIEKQPTEMTKLGR